MKPVASPTRRQNSNTIENTATSNQSVFNLVNGILGVGVLGFPYAFKMCGLALAACLVIFIVCVTLFSVRLLLLSSQLTGKKTYEEMAFQLYGRPGRLCINFCVIAINLGAVVSFLNVLADVLSSVSGTIIPPGLEPSRNEVLLGITVLAVLPISVFVQDAASLAIVSIGSVSIIFLFTLMMILSALQPASDLNVIRYWNTDGAFVSFPVIAYGFTIHIVIFPVYMLLRSPSVTKMSRISIKATWLCAVVYVLVGSGGYLTFGDRTHGDILRNLGAIDPDNVQSMRWFYERLLKLCYGASIIGTVPLVILPTLSLLLPMCDPCFGLGRTATKRLIAIFFIGLSYLCAVCIPNVEFILGLNGGTSSILISYIMPGLIYLKATSAAHETTVLSKTNTWNDMTGMTEVKEVDRSKTWKARGLVVLGVALAILCTSATLREVHHEHQVVSLVQEIVDKNKEMEDAAAVGQKTLQAVKAVDVVVTASKEIGDVKGDTAETLETLHTTAKNLNETLDNADESSSGGTFWQFSGRDQPDQNKQTMDAYSIPYDAPSAVVMNDVEAVLETIDVIMMKVNGTLASVETLQENLKSVAEEMKTERSRSESVTDSDERSKMDNFVKELTQALGISVDEETGVAEHTLDTVQKEFDIAIDALRDTLVILKRVKNVVQTAIEKGSLNSNLRELVVSAMEQAIHATQHSALALDLTEKALSDASDNQKSELMDLLSDFVKHSEHNVTSVDGPEADEKLKDETHTVADIAQFVSSSTEGVVSESDETQLNVTAMKITVKAAINRTTESKQNAVSEAHAAVKRAHPTVRAKAGEITKEIKTGGGSTQ